MHNIYHRARDPAKKAQPHPHSHPMDHRLMLTPTKIAVASATHKVLKEMILRITLQIQHNPSVQVLPQIKLAGNVPHPPLLRATNERGRPAVENHY